jgi:phosphatidylglycerophosphatase A
MAGPDIADATVLRDDRTAGAPPRRPTLRFMLRHPARWVAFGFGSGLAPWAPGTVGTLWAWAAFLVLDRWLGAAQWGLLLLAASAIGTWACARTARDLGLADPSAIVWDEVVGFWLVLWLVMPTGFVGQVLAFALFRFFDIAKPGPVRWADQRLKNARGWLQGWGILFDDLVAALCALLVLALVRFVWP